MEVLWRDFTSALNKLCGDCIPSKLVRGESSLPWLTQWIRRLVGKRDGLYTRYRKKGDRKVRDQFLALRQKTNRKSERHTMAIWMVSWGFLGAAEPVVEKGLFSFLKSSRQDREGIPPLKENDTLFTETHANANLCSRRFQSVLKCKSPLSLSRLAQMKVQDLVDEGSLPLGSVSDTNLSSVRRAGL